MARTSSIELTPASRTDPTDPTDPADPVSLAGVDPARLARVAATAYARIAEAWRLGNEAAAQLLDISPRTFARMKTGSWSGRFSRDQLMRVSAVTGLYKGLHLYFSDDLADRWVNMPNSGPLFDGAAPLDAMIAGGLPSILATRNYIDALRGGA